MNKRVYEYKCANACCAAECTDARVVNTYKRAVCVWLYNRYICVTCERVFSRRSRYVIASRNGNAPSVGGIESKRKRVLVL